MKFVFLLSPLDIIWTAIGVILTVVGTLLQVAIPSTVPWIGGYHFSLQIAGVLLTATLAGPTAGVYAQVIYLGLGLLVGRQIFSEGGGLDYLYRPSLGYLVGFLPAAWICGTIAFRPSAASSLPASVSRTSASSPFPPHRQRDPRNPSPNRGSLRPKSLIEMMVAGLAGLLSIHVTGLTYLLASQPWDANLLELVQNYSGYLLPGQLLVTVGVALLAVILRRVLLY
ncbi:MAG: biotin transporter BioY [Cyanobacteriota bacterium]|nr:biotin transporter BioY [Cyanobacteriota bacterium]